MFGRLKNLFSKPAEARPAPAPPPQAAPDKTVKPQQPPSVTSLRPSGVAPANAPVQDSIELPLSAIIKRLPEPLKSQAAASANSSAKISLLLKSILEQLPYGSVKVPFGDIRKAAPAGVFGVSDQADQTVVELPLSEILTRLKPAQLARRSAQQRVVLPAEVADLFGPQGGASARSQSAAVSQPVQSPTVPRPAAPAPVPAPPPSAKPAAPPQSAPLPAAPSAAIPLPVAPVGKIPVVLPLASPAVAGAPPPSAPIPAVQMPPPPPRPAGVTVPSMGAAPAVPSAAPIAPALPRPGVVEEPVRVPLAALGEIWPVEIKQVLAAADSSKTSFGLPWDDVASGLQRGKLSFSWSQLRSWITPSLAATPASSQDALQISLPLSVIAPIFLARHRPAKVQKKVSIGENIPNLFSGGAPAASVAAPAPSVAESLVPVPAPPSLSMAPPARPAAASTVPGPAPALPLPAPAAPGPIAMPRGPAFERPVVPVPKKDWTPQEIVKEAASLPGVAGALMATLDGLVVASQMPPDLSGEAIAAFLPQMHTRLAQCAQAFKCKETGRLSLIIDEVALQIFKASSAYLAVIGRAGQPLPQAQLIVIAARLSPVTK